MAMDLMMTVDLMVTMDLLVVMAKDQVCQAYPLVLEHLSEQVCLEGHLDLEKCHNPLLDHQSLNVQMGYYKLRAE